MGHSRDAVAMFHWNGRVLDVERTSAMVAVSNELTNESSYCKYLAYFESPSISVFWTVVGSRHPMCPLACVCRNS